MKKLFNGLTINEKVSFVINGLTINGLVPTYGFSYFGFGSLVPIESMMNSNKYIDVIEKKVIADTRRAFLDNRRNFQHDLALCHSFKKVKMVFRKYKHFKMAWKLSRP